MEEGRWTGEDYKGGGTLGEGTYGWPYLALALAGENSLSWQQSQIILTSGYLNTNARYDIVHCCTLSLCHLGSEMIITEIQTSIQRSSSGLLTRNVSNHLAPPDSLTPSFTGAIVAKKMPLRLKRTSSDECFSSKAKMSKSDEFLSLKVGEECLRARKKSKWLDIIWGRAFVLS